MMNSFLCFQLEAGAGEARQGEQGVMPGPAGLGKLLLCVLFVIISQQRMPGLFSPKLLTLEMGRSPLVSPGIIGYKISEEENEWRPTSKYFYSRTTNMQIASSWEF